VSIADFCTGIYTALAITAAIHHRKNTGEGQWIDMSLQDCVWLLSAVEYSPSYFLNGKILPKLGNGHPSMAPGNLYMAKDGAVIIATGVLPQVLRLYKAMGREDLYDTPLASNYERYKYKDQIDEAVGNWIKTKTVDEILEILRKEDVPCGPVPSFDKVCEDPQLKSREMIIEVEQKVSGPVKVPGSPFKMTRTPGNIKYPAPILGEHNSDVLSGMLGYTEAELKQFSDEGVIQSI
jgi:CoA:oxalate CoA-transferase